MTEQAAIWRQTADKWTDVALRRRSACQNGQQVLGLLVTDLLVHSWDLARSIGADETLPPEAVEAALMGLQRMPEQMLRGDAMFAPAVEVADDASPQDRLIAFAGRQP